MKHLSKIVLGSVLSVAMVLSAGFATANYKKVSAYEVPTTVQTSLIAENVVATKGHATWVKDKSPIRKEISPEATWTNTKIGRANIFNRLLRPISSKVNFNEITGNISQVDKLFLSIA